jgi:hypothetical protein
MKSPNGKRAAGVERRELAQIDASPTPGVAPFGGAPSYWTLRLLQNIYS